MAEETILGADTPAADADANTVVEQVEEKGLVNEDKDATEEAGKSEDSTADEPKVAPESYADFNIPEGMHHNEAMLAEASAVFKEIGLTQEQAQSLVNLDVKNKQAEHDETLAAWNKTMDDWRAESAADKEFGGTKLDESVVLAKKGRDAFGSAEFIQMLDVTGVGNHPEMVRFLVKLGKAISEDVILQGSGAAPKSKDASQIMFPNM
jgi:hypothetical protein